MVQPAEERQGENAEREERDDPVGIVREREALLTAAIGGTRAARSREETGDQR
jgi:hypothetical protein